MGVASGEGQQAFQRVVAEVGDTPWMAPHQGQRIWDYFERHRPSVALDIGTHLGASAVYMATAMRAFDIPGRVLTIDSAQTISHKTKEQWHDLWQRCGVDQIIEAVCIEDSNYAWWLARQLEKSVKTLGNGHHGLYDFVYLDGAKVFGIDAAAAILALDLIPAGGWLVLDDLDWSYQQAASIVSTPITSYEGGAVFRFSDDERRSSHVRVLYELVLRRSPLVGEGIEDPTCNWVWCRRA